MWKPNIRILGFLLLVCMPSSFNVSQSNSDLYDWQLLNGTAAAREPSSCSRVVLDLNGLKSLEVCFLGVFFFFPLLPPPSIQAGIRSLALSPVAGHRPFTLATGLSW